MNIRFFDRSRSTLDIGFIALSALLWSAPGCEKAIESQSLAAPLKTELTPPTSCAVCPDNLPDMVERISPGVVNISSTTIVHMNRMDDFFLFWGIPQERKQTSLGSGFIMDEEGYILTNNHVVEQASEVMVTLSDKRQFRAKIIGTDEKMDLALVQIKDKDRQTPKNIKYVPLGDSDLVRIAESVVAVGNPFGLQNTVTRGIISAKNRTIGLGPFDNFLQTDASINPGNSGGPLFNLKGEVIGITTAIRSNTGQSGGLGFAIPSNEAKKLIPDLKKYGRVPRPWLGILAERMTPQLEQYYELATSKGVLVYNIVQNAPADQSGLQQGDILVSVGDQVTLEPNDVERALAKFKPKDKVTIKVYRGKKMKEFQIKLEELPRLKHLPRGII
jgi:serine protease Do